MTRTKLNPATAVPSLTLQPPNGLSGILEVFGDPRSAVRADGTLDPRWEQENLTTIDLPFPIPLAGAPGSHVTKLYCHKTLAPVFAELFAQIAGEANLRDAVRTYGGCFNFRRKRTNGNLSAHAWGIAIDLNPETNPQGSKGDMDPELVQAFESFGFEWGGWWGAKSKDPMHFQFCTGY